MTFIRKQLVFTESPLTGSFETILFAMGTGESDADKWVKDNLRTLRHIIDRCREQKGLDTQYKVAYVPEILSQSNRSGATEYYAPGTAPETGKVDYGIFWRNLEDGVRAPEYPVLMMADDDDEYCSVFAWEIRSTSETEFLQDFDAFISSLGEAGGCFYSSTSDIEEIEEISDKPFTADSEFEYEVKMLSSEIRERIQKLRRYGVEEYVIKSLFEEQRKLSRLRISSDYKITLPDYGDIEIQLEPLPKAVYMLFLKHPEGISFKNLQSYRAELAGIYKLISGRVNIDAMEDSIVRVTDPFDNSINEKCSRIRQAFVSRFDDSLAENYYIYGYQGCPKRIKLDRALVEWE